MKKIFSTVIALIGFSVLMAQTSEVPTGVKMSFKEKFKSTTATWSANQQYYIASWDVSGKHMTAYYSTAEGTALVRTETDVNFTDLSSAVQTEINTRFLGNDGPYKVSRSFKVENMDGIIEGCELDNNGHKVAVFFNAEGVMSKREIVNQ